MMPILELNHFSLFLFGFLSVLLTCILILLSQKWHSAYSHDTDEGPQKIHLRSVPRIGGIGLLCGLFIGLFLGVPFAGNLVIGILPTFIAGISEDISKKITPRLRLSASIASAILLVWLLSLQLSANGIPFLYSLFCIPIFAMVITILSIALMAQSMNIIDGLNGLSIGSSLIMTAAIGSIAYMHGDIALAQFSLFFFACLAGIYVINFPRGLLFVGDGGAYLMGSVIGVLAILLAERNSSISSFASLLIVSYPIYETLRSFIRRTIDKNSDFSIADDQHFHSIIYRYIVKSRLLSRFNSEKLWIPNALSGISCCLLPVLSSCFAILFQTSMPALLICLVIIIVLYEGIVKILTKA